jgi:hypothetical protein
MACSVARQSHHLSLAKHATASSPSLPQLHQGIGSLERRDSRGPWPSPMKQLLLLNSKLTEHLVAQQDSMRFYPLCANCVSKVETVGGPPPADDVLFLV